jgi:transposase InsO family protein
MLTGRRRRNKPRKIVSFRLLPLGRRANISFIRCDGGNRRWGACPALIDRTTRWTEAIPLAADTAADCASTLLNGWIQCFGVPSTITSDRRPQFTSALWDTLCRLLSIKHSSTTVHHPQANGLVECFHRRPKDTVPGPLAPPMHAPTLGDAGNKGGMER